MKHTFYLLSTVLLFWSCSSSVPISKQPSAELSQNASNPTSTEEVNTRSSGLNLEQYRSSLSDTYTSRSNNVPAGYSKLKLLDESENEKDLYEGFRVQIYSGQSVALADTVASIFRAWSDTTIIGYQAETYTFFKAPYYRVHVGDFHDRKRAIYFSNLLKRRFKDAWVVYDRVNPYETPSDTSFIYTK